MRKSASMYCRLSLLDKTSSTVDAEGHREMALLLCPKRLRSWQGTGTLIIKRRPKSGSRKAPLLRLLEWFRPTGDMLLRS